LHSWWSIPRELRFFLFRRFVVVAGRPLLFGGRHVLVGHGWFFGAGRDVIITGGGAFFCVSQWFLFCVRSRLLAVLCAVLWEQPRVWKCRRHV